MGLKVYNTFTRQKEEFIPLQPPRVFMYNCGPTVYDTFHIGNTRNFIVADIIRRYLKYKKYDVKFVQNITDIDDKIIKRANKEGVPAAEIALRYTDYYFKYLCLLGVLPPDENPRATEHIPQMICFVKNLVDEKHAYVIDGDVFFRITSYPHYGELSGKNIQDLIEGARVEVDKRKENPLDFALWKSAKPGEPSWDSPWGKGRPGWHIECSVMSITHLAETIDIHSGGVDLVFPHHENERAQSEALSGKQFVRYWIHNGFLNINSEKMSKSLGNILTVDQILERFDPQVVRYFLLSAHYRHPLDYTETNMNDARNAWQRIVDTVISTDSVIQLLIQNNIVTPRDMELIDASFQNHLDEYRNQFESAMDDDFNTAGALAVYFNIISEMNQLRERLNLTLKNNEPVVPEDAALLNRFNHLLKELVGILGFSLPERGAGMNAMQDALIHLLIDIRQTARKQKNFEIADLIRSGLADMGIILEDQPKGTIWKYNR